MSDDNYKGDYATFDELLQKISELETRLEGFVGINLSQDDMIAELKASSASHTERNWKGINVLDTDLKRVTEVLRELILDLKRACVYDWNEKEIKISLQGNMGWLMKKLDSGGENSKPPEPSYSIVDLQRDVLHTLMKGTEPENKTVGMLSEPREDDYEQCRYNLKDYYQIIGICNNFDEFKLNSEKTVSILEQQQKAIAKVLLDNHYLRKHGKNAYYGQD